MTDIANIYAKGLRADLDMSAKLRGAADVPALSWRRSGLLQATKLMLPLPLISHVDGALMALKALAPEADLPQNGAVLMGERARLRGTVRSGRQCAGGYGRLLDAAGGRIALNLVREDDWGLVPAWLEADVSDWDGITKTVKSKSAQALFERGAEIGLAVALDALPPRPKSWRSKTEFTRAAPKAAPLVVDLSGLWAGPLASSLLQACGARVVKVEGPSRPDGMRAGHAGFYALLNAGKACAAFDFHAPKDLAALKRLLEHADIVIEASRPRALRQLGIRAEDYTARRPGKVWARLTAYGQREDRIGFGDDIGISAGLATVMERAYGQPCFAGDAIADPVSGVHLALAILAAYTSGGGAVLDIAMVNVLRYAMGDIPEDLPALAKAWTDTAIGDAAPLYPLRATTSRVHAPGEDTEAVMAALC